MRGEPIAHRGVGACAQASSASEGGRHPPGGTRMGHGGTAIPRDLLSTPAPDLECMRAARFLALLGLVLLVLPAAAAAGPSSPYESSGEQQALVLLNQIRQQHGLGPLVLSAPLRSAARAHTSDMLANGYFDHDAPGQTWDARVSHYLKSPLIGEVIALGGGASGSPAGIVSQWMRSAAHRRTILTAGFRRVGLGIAAGTFAGRPGVVLATADFAA